MVLSTVSVGQKITAAIWNALVAAVNAFSSGMNPVIPTSVAGTGVTLGSGGKVTFATSSTISVNGCFTTTYDNYELWLNITATSTTGIPQFQLRLAGTDATAANYDTQVIVSSSTTLTAVQGLAGTNYTINAATGAFQDCKVSIVSPFLAAPTRAMDMVQGTNNPMTTSAAFQQRTMFHRLSTSYDGFTITASTGTFSGSLRVYGWNNL